MSILKTYKEMDEQKLAAIDCRVSGVNELLVAASSLIDEATKQVTQNEYPNPDMAEVLKNLQEQISPVVMFSQVDVADMVLVKLAIAKEQEQNDELNK